VKASSAQTNPPQALTPQIGRGFMVVLIRCPPI
jgi:hypothetical protein